MIVNSNKYRKFLSVLSTVGIFLNFSYADSFSYNLASTHMTTYKKTSILYKEVLPLTKETSEKQTIINNDPLEVAKKFAPANIEEITTESINDEMGELLVVKVYLDYSVELEDDKYFIATNNANKAINSKKILIKYL